MAISCPIGKGKGRYTSMPSLLFGKDRHACTCMYLKILSLEEWPGDEATTLQYSYMYTIAESASAQVINMLIQTNVSVLPKLKGILEGLLSHML